MVIRSESIQHENEFDVRINDLNKKTISVKENINQIFLKNEQYKKAAKYLIAINKYLPIKLEYEGKSGFKKKKYETVHEGEITMYNHAAEQLNKMGVDLNVDPDKVMALISSQEEKIKTLSAELKGIVDKIDKIKLSQQVINNIKTDIRIENKDILEQKENKKENISL